MGNLITSNKVIIRHEINPNYDVHISDSQAKRIKDKVDEIASFVPKNKRKEESANIYGLIKDMCRTTSYRLIKQEQFDEVMTYLRKLEVSYERNRPKTDDNAEWRKRKY